MRTLYHGCSCALGGALAILEPTCTAVEEQCNQAAVWHAICRVRCSLDKLAKSFIAHAAAGSAGLRMVATSPQPRDQDPDRAADWRSYGDVGADLSVLTPPPNVGEASTRAVLLQRGLSGVRYVLPLLVVAIVLILAAGTYYVRWGFTHAQWHGRPQAVPVWLAFNDIGMQFAAKIGDSQEAVA